MGTIWWLEWASIALQTETNTKNMPNTDIIQDYSFWWEENIRWGDQDSMGHVNNVQVARYIEASRIPFLHNLSNEADGAPAQFILARLEVNYLIEMHFPGNVRIGTSVEHIGSTSVTLAHGLFQEKVCAGTGKSIVVHLDSRTRRPKSLSHSLREQLLNRQV